MSYCHAQKGLVKDVYANMKKDGQYDIWIDSAKPPKAGQSILEWMGKGIGQSDIVLIFMTADYQKSKNCQKEAEVARKKQKRTIFVKAQENYEENEWLSTLRGEAFYINLTKDFDENMQLLMTTIKQEFEDLEGSPDNKPTNRMKHFIPALYSLETFSTK